MSLSGFNRAALEGLVRANPHVLRRAADAVRDEARTNVPSNLKGERSSQPEKAIISVPGSDADGPYVDVGYDKTHPGFYLWWHEVGTADSPPQPHLRPAVRPGLI